MSGIYSTLFKISRNTEEIKNIPQPKPQKNYHNAKNIFSFTDHSFSSRYIL